MRALKQYLPNKEGGKKISSFFFKIYSAENHQVSPGSSVLLLLLGNVFSYGCQNRDATCAAGYALKAQYWYVPETTGSGLFFTILYDVIYAVLMDTRGLFSFSLSIQVHQTFALKISCIYDILFLGHRVISSKWQMTTSRTKEAGGSFSCEAVLFISSLSSHRQNINMHVQNEHRLNPSKSEGEEHRCVRLRSSWTERFFSSGGILCHCEAVKLWLVIGREMRIPLAKNGQRAVNVICLVPNNTAVNVFFFFSLYKMSLFWRDDSKLLSNS